MLTPLTPRQQTLIVNNIVAACGDIEKLNKPAYRWLNLASGFIAHYDLYGFRAAYSAPGSLARDIMRFVSQNEWNNFHPTDRDYLYYMNKKETYRRIVTEIQRRYW
jgi:hypothetical protein